MSDTPRTDEFQRTIGDLMGGPVGYTDIASYNRLLDFARQLERELRAAQERGEAVAWMYDVNRDAVSFVTNAGAADTLKRAGHKVTPLYAATIVEQKCQHQHKVSFTVRYDDCVKGPYEQCMDCGQAAPAPAAGMVMVPVEPICGKRYEAGDWSRRNYEAWLDDQAAAPAAPVTDDEIRLGVRLIKREFLAWRIPPVDLPSDSVIERCVRAIANKQF